MMKDLLGTAYFQLLTAFLKAIGQADMIDSIDKEEGIVEWSVGNLLVRLVPHLLNEQETEEVPEPDAVLIEADLMLLNLENKKVNHDRFLILHQLNSASRLTTGIVATISDEGMLSISNIISLRALESSEEKLANQLAQVIKAAEELYEGWNALAELEVQSSSKKDQEKEQMPAVNQIA